MMSNATLHPTTTPGVTLWTANYREGFGTIVPSDAPVLIGSDVFRYKLRADGVAILRWEAPAHMASDYRRTA